jgi:uncharacterized protein
MTGARITAIQRWPVKGLGPDRLDDVMLTEGQPLPLDRAWAIENGPSGFDPDDPRPLPKIKFLMLMRDERLAALDTRFDETTRMLSIFRNGRRVAGGRLDDLLGRKLIEQFLAAYMARELRGPPRLLSAPGHTFSDCGKPVVSLIALETLRDLERVAGRTIDPMRFRGNICIDGWAPWAEFDLVGQEISLGPDAVARIVARIRRCAATNVDPASGARDMQIPRLLEGAFGHADFGVYAEIVRGGRIARDAAVTGAKAPM